MPRLPRISLPILVLLAACGGTEPPPTISKPNPAPIDASTPPVATLDADAGARALPRPTDAEICAMQVIATVKALPSKPAPPVEEPFCAEKDPFCDEVDKAPNPKNACFVANDNLEKAARASHATHSGPAPANASSSSSIANLDRIDAHFHFTPEERAKLMTNNFVVLDRLPYSNYANAFHDVFQEELPLYVSSDAIFHAVWRGTELALEHVEVTKLAPALTRLLKKLTRGLAASAGRYDKTTRDDLDVYLGVGDVLFAPRAENAKVSVLGNDDKIREIASHASNGALESVEMFGRSRMIDFSQLTPRGHYAQDSIRSMMGSPDLSAYFESMMWLSRLEWNLVSRSSRSSEPGESPNPEETPREAVDAMALADLIERTGASAELALFEDTYRTFAGTREDVSPAEMSRLMHANHIAPMDKDAFAKLKAAIGNGYVRTARTHFMPQNSPNLPVISTMVGPRIVPDIAPLTRLVHDKTPERYNLGGADVAYLLGHDRAKKYLEGDLKTFQDLQGALDGARADLTKSAAGKHDVYGTWLSAILAVSAPPPASAPSFAKTDAYADRRIETALTGYGQLRHAFVLLAGQGYDAYGCEIPDAYVEPAPAVFDALLAHVRGMRAHVDATSWVGLEKSLEMLDEIAHTEAHGDALTEPQKRWLGMVSEFIPRGGMGGDSGEPPKWTGWYFDMFADREISATARTTFIADYFTLTNKNIVRYLGAEGPRLGVFIVDAGGGPRAMVGPVAKSFEAWAPIEGRLDDSHAMDAPNKSAAWRDTFAVAPREEPTLGLTGVVTDCKTTDGVEMRVAVRSAKYTGKIGITLLDHHADAVTETASADASTEWRAIVFRFPTPTKDAGVNVEAIHVHVDDLSRANAGTGAWDLSTSPSVFYGKDYGDTPMPERDHGAGDFVIGAPALAAAPYRPNRGNPGAPIPAPGPDGVF